MCIADDYSSRTTDYNISMVAHTSKGGDGQAINEDVGYEITRESRAASGGVTLSGGW